jgi:hypothetical protein
MFGHMAELKTKKHDGDVDAFLAGIEDEAKREDARALRRIMAEVTGDEGAMWGDSIVGFGSYHYRYASGREGDWFEVGFSPRKRSLTLYLMSGFEDREGLLSRLGKHSTGKACLYVNRLSDVDRDVLRRLVQSSVDQARSS